jgi:hypothetical protein
VAVDFGALAGLTEPCPGAAVFLHACPHKTLRDQFSRCLRAWVTGRARSGTPAAAEVLGCTAEVFRWQCRSRARRWCQESGFSPAVEPFAFAGVPGVRRQRLMLRPVRRGLLDR